MRRIAAIKTALFQSTLPARGATVRGGPAEPISADFNPRSPRGERLLRGNDLLLLDYFNPRSPRGERRCCTAQRGIDSVFQSTLPARGATSLRPYFNFFVWISIHAPREGSDGRRRRRCTRFRHFNPRSPRGERPGLFRCFAPMPAISIHAPREGSDVNQPSSSQPNRDFNPRSPRGERPAGGLCDPPVDGFQSTLPARGATPGWCPP